MCVRLFARVCSFLVAFLFMLHYCLLILCACVGMCGLFLAHSVVLEVFIRIILFLIPNHAHVPESLLACDLLGAMIIFRV